MTGTRDVRDNASVPGLVGQLDKPTEVAGGIRHALDDVLRHVKAQRSGAWQQQLLRPIVPRSKPRASLPAIWTSVGTATKSPPEVFQVWVLYILERARHVR